MTAVVDVQCIPTYAMKVGIGHKLKIAYRVYPIFIKSLTKLKIDPSSGNGDIVTKFWQTEWWMDPLTDKLIPIYHPLISRDKILHCHSCTLLVLTNYSRSLKQWHSTKGHDLLFKTKGHLVNQGNGNRRHS